LQIFSQMPDSRFFAECPWNRISRPFKSYQTYILYMMISVPVSTDKQLQNQPSTTHPEPLINRLHASSNHTNKRTPLLRGGSELKNQSRRKMNHVPNVIY
jgi:hypothetical protein